MGNVSWAEAVQAIGQRREDVSGGLHPEPGIARQERNGALGCGEYDCLSMSHRIEAKNACTWASASSQRRAVMA